MTRLKITKTNGDVSEHDVSPKIKYAFEIYAKKGFHKAFREDEMQTNLYWLAWECLRDSGETVEIFGSNFIGTLSEVEVIDSDPLV